MILHELRCVFVMLPREHARAVALIAQGVGDEVVLGRENRGGDAVLVHDVEGHLGRPRLQRAPAGDDIGLHDLYVEGRQQMVMDVDAALGSGGSLLRKQLMRRKHCACSGNRQQLQEPPARMPGVNAGGIVCVLFRAHLFSVIVDSHCRNSPPRPAWPLAA